MSPNPASAIIFNMADMASLCLTWTTTSNYYDVSRRGLDDKGPGDETAGELKIRQGQTVKLSDQPGWITFSIDGRYALPSTGDVIDARTKAVVTTLRDEKGGPVQSEKMVEIGFSGGRPVLAGDQFGIGRRK